MPATAMMAAHFPQKTDQPPEPSLPAAAENRDFACICHCLFVI